MKLNKLLEQIRQLILDMPLTDRDQLHYMAIIEALFEKYREETNE